jgi:hypothetical protein
MQTVASWLPGRRKHPGAVLRTLTPEDSQRRGKHSEAEPIMVEDLLTNITNHIPYHLKFHRPPT